MTHPDSNLAEPKRSPGNVAFDAYRETVSGLSAITGEPLPTWEELRVNHDRALIIAAWEEAARAVLAYFVFDVEAQGDDETGSHPAEERIPNGNAPKRDVVLGIDL
jgi:hypothetical protein